MANERRLIDADELFEKVKQASKDAGFYRALYDGFLKQIENSSSVDAVIPVRCKDCKHYDKRFGGEGYCYYWDYEQGMSPNTVDEDDFCSYGERSCEDDN